MKEGAAELKQGLKDMAAEGSVGGRPGLGWQGRGRDAPIASCNQ